MESQEKISKIYDSLKAFSLEKNRRYGDSALNPIKIFSKANASNSILIRLDDKVSRIKNSDKIRKNDVCDIMGYLMLYCAANDWLDFSDQID